MIRAAAVDPASQETRALEFKPGQIVRAVVQELLPNGEAQLNIAGVTVKAKLEANLPVGTSTWLQVQPESTEHTIHMKPLKSVTVELTPEVMMDLLKHIGLKDTPLHRELVRSFHQEGINLNRNISQNVVSVLSELGSVGETHELLRAATIAARQGVPITSESVRALHQTIAGPPLHELVGTLTSLAQETIDSLPNRGQLGQVSGRLLDVLQRVNQLVSNLYSIPASESQPEQTSKQTVNSPPMEIKSELTLPPHPKIAPPIQDTSVNSVQDNELQQSSIKSGVINQGSLAVTSEGLEQESPAHQQERSPLFGLFKLLGFDVEREWLRASAAPSVLSSSQDGSDRILPSGVIPSFLADVAIEPVQIDGKSGHDRVSPLDTLKSVLQQLASFDETPPALKEAAQTAIQHITGQQLLLHQDRIAPFAFATLLLPIPGNNGEQSATVQIHTRKGKRGELDAENCRLWFQLALDHLGETWVDVQVTNRIVSLQVWNDQPSSQALVLANKSRIEMALKSIGYQLFTFKTAMKPKSEQVQDTNAAIGMNRAQTQPSPIRSSPPYKGVDMRI